MSYGIYKRTNSSQVEIQELPIRSWTDKYKEFLESMIIAKPDQWIWSHDRWKI